MRAYINQIGTAVPKNKIAQCKIADFMGRALQLDSHERRRLDVLYRACGIQTRHSVISDYGNDVKDYSFFPKNDQLEPFPQVANRMKVYEEEAAGLCLEAIETTLPGDFNKKSISHLITVSCTGMYAPGLDIELTKKLGLRSTVNRTAINFMGCYGAFNGLKLAASIVTADPAAKVLLVSVELCTIHFQNRKDPDTLLANALFGDGAAAALISNQPTGKCLKMEGFHTDIAFDGNNEMAWQIGNHGFEMKLSTLVPDIIEKHIKQLTDRLLENYAAGADEIDHYAIHPGGKKILEVIEKELGITKEKNDEAYRVLKEYGNMSSPTVLFVLKQVFDKLDDSNVGQQVLSFAFGPGLTLESMLLKYCHNEKILT